MCCAGRKVFLPDLLTQPDVIINFLNTFLFLWVQKIILYSSYLETHGGVKKDKTTFCNNFSFSFYKIYFYYTFLTFCYNHSIIPPLKCVTMNIRSYFSFHSSLNCAESHSKDFRDMDLPIDLMNERPSLCPKNHST